VNIKPMLARFQSAIGRDDLAEEMILLPGLQTPGFPTTKSSPLTLVVGYNGSPSSHTALDITLLIAHQTRLATGREVAVKVAYVIDGNHSSKEKTLPKNYLISHKSSKLSAASGLKLLPADLLLPQVQTITTSDRQKYPDSEHLQPSNSFHNIFERAEQILWQARYLIEEWGDAFIAHLRIGCIAAELGKVVSEETADLLFLGCQSANHPIVRKLGANFPCPVLGIPDWIDNQSFI